MNAAVKHEVSLFGLAQETLSSVDGKTEEAIALLDQKLSKDSNLRKAVISEAVKEASKTAISLVHRIDRATIMRAIARPVALNGKEGVRSLAAGLARSLLDFPLLDGTKLRDAGKEDLGRAIAHYQSQADTMAHRARWLAAVDLLVPAEGRVGDVLDDAGADRLFQEAGR